MLNRDEVLLNKTIKVVPVIREGSWLPKGHDGEFMFTGCKRGLCLPLDKTGRFVKIITDEEQKFFEEVLNLEPNTLSIYNKASNYWSQTNFYVVLDKEGITLDLRDPIDNLKWRVLKANPTVAPSWEERFDSGEYAWALVDSNYESEETASNFKRKTKAYALLAKITNSKDKMRDVLRIYGKRTSGDESDEWLQAELSKIVESGKAGVEKLINIFEDTDFEMKLFVEKAIEVGAIQKNKTRYMLPGGDVIGVGLDDTVAKLKEYKKNTDEVYLTIAARVDKSNK